MLNLVILYIYIYILNLHGSGESKEPLIKTQKNFQNPKRIDILQITIFHVIARKLQKYKKMRVIEMDMG